MTADQQPRTPAQAQVDYIRSQGQDLEYDAELALARAEEVAASVAALADRVNRVHEQLRAVRHDHHLLEYRVSALERGQETLSQSVQSLDRDYVTMRDRLAALESPAAAPEPDPLCAREWCGHPKSEHGGGEANCYHMDMPTMSCVLKCACERFVPQPSPATAHQEPPDAVLVCQCGHSKGHHHPYCHGNHEWMPSGCRCREFVPQAESIDAVNLLIRDINRFGQLRFQFGMSLEHGDMENAEENRIAARELEVKIEAAIRAYGRDGAR